LPEQIEYKGVEVKNTVFFVALILILASCSVATKRQEANPNTPSGELLKIQQEVSLTSDREKLSELRKDMPEPVQEENDELKFILDFFQDIRKNPSRIRQEFDRIVRRKQDKLRKSLQKQRKKFTKQERKDREDFLKKLKEEREEFLKSEANTKEGRKEFFDKQDEQRKEYFADAREKRKDFESQVSAIQKDSYAYFRDKRKQFSEEMRIFQRRQREWKKEQKEKRKKAYKSSSSNNYGSLYPQQGAPAKAKTPLELEFEAFEKLPTETLESE
jgi:chromosome segregation ATPase